MNITIVSQAIPNIATLPFMLEIEVSLPNNNIINNHTKDHPIEPNRPNTGYARTIRTVDQNNMRLRPTKRMSASE